MRKVFKQNIWRPKFTNEGFTLFEMLVAIGLIVVFSALIAANYTDFRQRNNLKAETEKLSSLIRKAQLWALTGQTRGGVRPPGGWGVYVEECTTPPCRFFLYADMTPVLPPNHSYDALGDEIVSEVFTQQHVQIASVNPANLGNAVDLVFTSPTSTGYINGDQVDNQAVITFFQANVNESQSVTIDRKTNRIVMGDVLALPPPPPQCSDGIDNDGDTLIDAADPGCENAQDNSEDSVILPDPRVLVFEDTFTTAGDTELSLHAPDLTPTPGNGWQQIFSVVGNNHISGSTLMAQSANNALAKLSASCGAGGGAFYKTVDVFNTPNVLVEVKFELTSSDNNYGMLGARIQSNGDMYLFEWSPDHGKLFLHKDGMWLQLGLDTAGVSQDEEVRMVVYGNRINISKFNGSQITLLINEIDDQITTSGSAGLGLGAVVTYDGDCDPQRLDNFKVWENIVAPSSQCYDGIENDLKENRGVSDGTDQADPNCSAPGAESEYTTPPQVLPVFYDDFNVDNNVVLDDGSYPVLPFGLGWQRIISIDNGNPSTNKTLRAAGSNDRLEDGGSCGGDDGALYQTLDDFTSVGPDYEVTTNYVNENSGVRYSIIAARIQDALNMYAFQWSTSQGQLWVRNGSWSQLGSDTAGFVEGDEVTLKVKGNTIDVLKNGVSVLPLPITDTTHAAAGHAGVGMGAVITTGADCATQYLDNFKVIVP